MSAYSDIELQLGILDKIEASFARRLSRIDKDYGRNLLDSLVEIHRKMASMLHASTEIDSAHISYRSLVLGEDWYESGPPSHKSGIEAKRVRKVFNIGKFERLKVPYDKFAYEVDMYEPEFEILPSVDCHFCSIFFSPVDIKNPLEYIEQGIYPIGPATVEIISDILIKTKMCPWRLNLREEIKAQKIFKNSQGVVRSYWEEMRHDRGLIRILPDIDGIFELAIKSSIITMNLISPKLFEACLNYPLAPHMENWKPGMRKGVLGKTNLLVLKRKLLADINECFGGTKGRHLLFLPIRIGLPSGMIPKFDDRGIKHKKESIGLIALGSSLPFHYTVASSLAVIEHLVFLVCRQMELFLVRDYYSKNMVQLEIQRFFARLMAHEISKPFGEIDDYFKLISSQMDNSRKMLRRFATGTFSGLEQERLDLYDVLLNIRERYQSKIVTKNIEYEDDVKKFTYVYADPYTIEYTLGVLIGNAIEHGLGHVNIKTLRVKNQAGIDFISVIISNDGLPMDQEVEDGIKKGYPPVKMRTIEAQREEYGKGLALAFEYSRLMKWPLRYHPRQIDGRTFQYIFEIWLPIP
jgi:hypothetical protein